MYCNLPPQIKGSIKKEQVLLANNLFVSSCFQQTIAKWFVITYTFGCWSCIIHSVVCFRCNFVCNFLSCKWQLVWQLVLDGWFGWLQALAVMALGVLTFAAGKSNQVFFSLVLAICIKRLIVCSKCLIVHDLLFHLTKATHLNLILYVPLQLLRRY